MKSKMNKIQVELIYVTYTNYGKKFLILCRNLSKLFGVEISITQIDNGSDPKRISACDKYTLHSNELWEFGAWKRGVVNTNAEYIILANDTIGVRQPIWVTVLVFLYFLKSRKIRARVDRKAILGIAERDLLYNSLYLSSFFVIAKNSFLHHFFEDDYFKRVWEITLTNNELVAGNFEVPSLAIANEFLLKNGKVKWLNMHKNQSSDFLVNKARCIVLEHRLSEVSDDVISLWEFNLARFLKPAYRIHQKIQLYLNKR